MSKREKMVEKVLTTRAYAGILTKLSGRMAASLKRMVKNLKKALDKLWETVVI
ncbi:hypothetical protein [uncultured Oscillibacter sp.]|uniref:hypothetical protein n=1 Tax=uncultured Oscillibacter sp. TaxID=876091 RepID=UPI0025CBBA2A|nr:hypothetical protein [uncultured Oscillibacter sp.]